MACVASLFSRPFFIPISSKNLFQPIILSYQYQHATQGKSRGVAQHVVPSTLMPPWRNHWSIRLYYFIILLACLSYEHISRSLQNEQNGDLDQISSRVSWTKSSQIAISLQEKNSHWRFYYYLGRWGGDSGLGGGLSEGLGGNMVREIRED